MPRNPAMSSTSATSPSFGRSKGGFHRFGATFCGQVWWTRRLADEARRDATGEIGDRLIGREGPPGEGVPIKERDLPANRPGKSKAPRGKKAPKKVPHGRLSSLGPIEWLRSLADLVGGPTPIRACREGVKTAILDGLIYGPDPCLSITALRGPCVQCTSGARFGVVRGPHG